MKVGRRLRQRLSWLALCAIVLVSVAPGISKALAATQGVTWVEMCTINGLQRVPLDVGTQEMPDPSKDDSSYCGYCTLQQHFPILLSSSASFGCSPVAWHRLPVGNIDTAIVTRFIRYAHHTRAPPDFS